MNIKQTIIAAAAILMMASTASAQGLLGKLKDKAVKAGQKKLEQVVTQKAEQVIEGAVTPTADRQPATADSPASAATEGTGIAADAVSYDVPNPYTDWDVPTDYTKVALGLPKNDSGDKPALQKPRDCVSYAAFKIPRGDGSPGKTFYNAENKRTFTINYVNDRMGGKRITRSLTIPDSAAIYQIDHQRKTITKVSAGATMRLTSTDTKNRKTKDVSEDIVSEADRWCYSDVDVLLHDGENALGSYSEEITLESRNDLETGIEIYNRNGSEKTYLRNIHVGLYYPELFELPKGYKWIVRDFSRFIEQDQQANDRMRQVQERVNGRTGNKKGNSDSEGDGSLIDALNKLGTLNNK